MWGISQTSRMVRWCACTSAYGVACAPERRLAKTTLDRYLGRRGARVRTALPATKAATTSAFWRRDALDPLVMRSLLPGPEDWDAVRLPEWLEWLYWPLRPARLLAKYARAAVRERRRFPHVRHT